MVKNPALKSVPVRDDIRGITPYESWDVPIKARLNTNENPYPLPDVVVDAITQAVHSSLKNSNRYPKDQHLELREEIVKYLQRQENVEFTPDQVLGANGSNEIGQELLLAFGGPSPDNSGLAQQAPDSNAGHGVAQPLNACLAQQAPDEVIAEKLGERVCLTFAPTYSMYPQYARDSFTKYVVVPRKADGENPDFSIDTAAAVDAIRKFRPTLILIANPNNPTGGFTPLEDIEKIVSAALEVEAAGCSEPSYPVVVVDEAYTDFRKENEASALSLVNKYPNIVVMRTLSKAFAMAGIRFGFAVSSPEIINAMKIVRLPYNLSTVTQAVATTALQFDNLQLEKVVELKASRDDLFDFLTEQTWNGKPLKIVPSSANFIQVGFPAPEEDGVKFAKSAFEELMKNDVQIRLVGPKGYFRVTVGTPEECEMFKAEFGKFLQSFGVEK